MRNTLQADLYASVELLEERAMAEDVYSDEAREAYEHANLLLIEILFDHNLPRPDGELGLRETSASGIYDRRDVWQDRKGDYWIWDPQSGWVFGETEEECDYYAKTRIHRYSPEPSNQHGPYTRKFNAEEELWDFQPEDY